MSEHPVQEEHAFLCALLLKPERVPEFAAFDARDLVEDRSRVLLACLRDLDARGVPIDFLTVAEALRADGSFQRVGGAQWLAQLAESVTTAQHASAHARIVADHAHKRRLAAALAGLTGALTNGTERQAEAAAAKLRALLDVVDDARGDPPDAPLRWNPFPTNALPPALARYVNESATAIGVDEALVALPLLAAAAAAIGTTRRVQLKTSWGEPSILWAAPVAVSGSTKSSAIDAALRFTHAANAGAMAEHDEALRAYQSATLAFERELATWKHAKQSAPPPERPLEPRPRRVLASDATLESVGALLANNPRGLLLARDELAGWFGSHGRYSGARVADASGWLELHGARPLTIDRKAAGPLHVARAACSITGTIQPATLRQQATPEALASGLFARFLLAWPPARPRVWTEATVAPETIAAAARVFDALFALDASDGEPIDLPLTLEARAIWVEYFETHAKRTASVGAHLAAAFSKLEGAAARLALVHALAVDPDADAVDADSMRAGVVLATWFADEAERIYAMLLDAPREDVATIELVDLIRRRGESITPAELARTSRHWRPASRARAALARLHRMGLGKLAWVQPGESGGRPFERFELAEPDRPSVTVSETSAGHSADGGCSDGRQATARPCADGRGKTGAPASADAALSLADPGDAPYLPRDLKDRAASEHSERAQSLELDVPPRDLFGDDNTHDCEGH